jgi:DNA mismatch repair protein MSH5
MPLENSAHVPSKEGSGRSTEREDDDDSLNEVVLAVDLRERGTVGCAYYLAREEKIFCMEDWKLGSVTTVDARKLAT